VDSPGALTGACHTSPHVQSDVPACKAYINLIDTVLLPFDPSTPPPTDYTAAAAVVGAQGCVVQANALINGTEVKAGDANRQAGSQRAIFTASCWGFEPTTKQWETVCRTRSSQPACVLSSVIATTLLYQSPAALRPPCRVPSAAAASRVPPPPVATPGATAPKKAAA
jgi:hypothetical protein